MCELSFIESVDKYAQILTEWTSLNKHILDIVIMDNFIYNGESLPNSSNKCGYFNIIKNSFLNKVSRKGINTLTSFHAEETFHDYITDIIETFWGYYIEKAEFDTSGYQDFLIRRVLVTHVEPRIAYLCLKIVSGIELTPEIQNEINISTDICPQLPFDSHEREALLDITKTEKRLRIAISLITELGHASKKENIKISTGNFIEDIRSLLKANGLNNLQLLKNCLLASSYIVISDL